MLSSRWVISHAFLAVFHEAIGVGGEQAEDILQEDVRGAEFINSPPDLVPQPRPRVLFQPFPAAGSRYVRAREPCGKEINAGNILPLYQGYVIQVEDIRVAVCQDLLRTWLDVCNEHQLGLPEDILQGQLDATVACAETADPDHFLPLLWHAHLQGLPPVITPAHFLCLRSRHQGERKRWRHWQCSEAHPVWLRFWQGMQMSLRRRLMRAPRQAASPRHRT